jgi:hypothetical protein
LIDANFWNGRGKQVCRKSKFPLPSLGEESATKMYFLLFSDVRRWVFKWVPE